MTAREAAYRSLLRVEKESRYSNLETDLTLKRAQLSDKDARLYTRLVYGTIEKKLTIDRLLAPLVRGELSSLDREVLVLLRLGAYQILFSDRVPDSAAVYETVELCKKYRKSASTLVNAVLRRLSREKGDIVFPDEKSDPIGYLSAFYSVSPELCALFAEEFGFEETKRLLAAFDGEKPATLRVNTLKTSREDLMRVLTERGFSCEKTPLSSAGVRLLSGNGALSVFESEECFVQDEASQLAVEALDARPGMTVLDLCACPGGKSFGAAMSMENRGTVLSFDLHANKLPLIEEGAKRLGVTIIRTAAADGRTFLPELQDAADRVLVDAPCSGLGVLSKKPDLRYKNADDIERLPGIQTEILNNAARYLKPGGRLIYSTCTLLQRENEEVVDAFLAAHPDFAPDDLRLPALAPGRSRITLLPHIHHTDGFFIAAMKKIGPLPEKEKLVPLSVYLPEASVELRYATADNFTGRRVYDFTEGFLRYGTVQKLKKAAHILARQGLTLKIWDAYRPVRAQFRLFEVCPDPRYVADPRSGFSNHSRGGAVDVTLCSSNGTELEMPSAFDDFSPQAGRSYADCTPEAKKNALLLETVLTECGFTGYSAEWWHFDDTDCYGVIAERDPV